MARIAGYEREQYEARKVREFQFTPIDVYGAEHLLRLLIKIPSILVKTNLSPSEVSQLTARLSELVRYLAQHKADLFLNTYDLCEAHLGPYGASAK